MFTPDVKAALEADLNMIRKCEGIAERHKSYIINNTIKKYQSASVSNEFCPDCKVRPIYDDKCRQCLGKSALSWG